MKYKKAYSEWLLEYFGGNEDEAADNFNDPELYEEFIEVRNVS